MAHAFGEDAVGTSAVSLERIGLMDALDGKRSPSCRLPGANLVPKLLRAHRTNGDDRHRFFECFVSVSLGSCSLVFT